LEAFINAHLQESATPLVYSGFGGFLYSRDEGKHTAVNDFLRAAPRAHIELDQSTGQMLDCQTSVRVVAFPNGSAIISTMNLASMGSFDVWAHRRIVSLGEMIVVLNQRDRTPQIFSLPPDVSVGKRAELALSEHPVFLAIALRDLQASIDWESSVLIDSAGNANVSGLQPDANELFAAEIPTGRRFPLYLETRAKRTMPEVIMFPNQDGTRTRLEMYYDRLANDVGQTGVVRQYFYASTASNERRPLKVGERRIGQVRFITSISADLTSAERAMDWRQFAPLAPAPKVSEGDALGPETPTSTRGSQIQDFPPPWQPKVTQSQAVWVYALRYGGLALVLGTVGIIAYRRFR